MRIKELISESRGSLLGWLKQQFPTWPDYIIKDFLYQQTKTITSQEQLSDWMAMMKNDYNQVKWRLENLRITLDIFTPNTQKRIRSREGGSSNPFGVPRDAERHAQQLKMIQQQGVRTEPIIVVKLSNGYDLIEGWHRTIQHLKAFPEGYTGPAWVGYGVTYVEKISENKNPGYKAGEPYWEQKPQEKAYVVYDSDGNEVDRFEYQHVWDSSPAMNKATEKLKALRVDFHRKKKAEQYAIDQAKPLRDLEKRYLDMLSSIKRYERYIYPQTKEDDILDTETKELYMQTVIKWYKELERISPAVRPSIINGTYKPQN